MIHEIGLTCIEPDYDVYYVQINLSLIHRGRRGESDNGINTYLIRCGVEVRHGGHSCSQSRGGLIAGIHQWPSVLLGMTMA